MNMNNILQFRVSTGLKRVLGRELITDDEVAIFELVKNSFDAAAKDVYLHFDDDCITIADDGIGMSLEDLQEKWLFVAYSEKRNNSTSYRNQISDRQQQYAGSKGIGRFSSDRLGQFLQLQTKPKNRPDGSVHYLDINWGDFDVDDTEQFSKINVKYYAEQQFDLPSGIPKRKHGTVIRISMLEKKWTHDDLVRLRSGLAKLINPFGSSTDDFRITIIADNERANDAAAIERYEKKSPDNREEQPPIVNGRVGNFIFETLQQKTTFISVEIDPITNIIETSLIDRGELIYRIREPNAYPLLEQAAFRCELFYLNRSAKATFARRVGLPAVRFGSVFLFRNGFRVFPIGEDGDDWFQIDRRKQQGYNRFLGTREIIGRIDVSGTDDMFQEASSRNQGLIETPAVVELKACFKEHCLKRLEKYVVPVSWPAKDEIDTLALIETDSGRARVAAAFANLIGTEDVKVVQYSTRLIDIINERSEQFESSLTSLRLIARTTGDLRLAKRIEEAEEKFTELKHAEAEARRIADQERRAKQEAEARAEAATREAHDTKLQLGEERKRNLFLTSITSLEVDTVINLHHSITTCAANLQIEITNLMLEIGNRSSVPRDILLNRLDRISLQNQKVLAIARFATKANFRIESEFTEEDLSDYIASYIEGAGREFLGGNIDIEVNTDSKELRRKFKPIDISIVIDNLVVNAQKARASKIIFDLKQPRKGLLEIKVSDNGRGILPDAANENRLFEKGFTTTDGSGLGLYHVRQVLGEMGGSIEVLNVSNPGASFLLRIPV